MTPARPERDLGRRAAVVGGGIGGMAAALALARRGWRVRVFERAAELGEVGAGLQMSPNASRCLAALGVLGAVEARAFEPRAAALRDGRTGRAVLSLPLREAARRRWGAPYLHVHRADLLAALAEAARGAGVEVTLGAPVEGVDGPAGRLGPGEDAFDLVVAADGLRSRLRDAIGGPAAPRFAGQVAWRATVPAAALPDGLIPPDATVWAGPGRHLVTYYLRGGELVNLVGVEETSDWVEEGWSVPGDPERLRALFAGWHGAVTQLLARVEAPLRWGLFDRAEPRSWVAGRAALLGDACHPMLPFMAQGAAMALEDAVVLTAAIGDGEVPAGLARYEAARRPRTRRVQETSRANASLFHATGAARQLRHGVIGLGSWLLPGVAAGRLDWLYGHDAPAALAGEGARG